MYDPSWREDVTRDEEIQQALREIETLVGKLRSAVKTPDGKPATLEKCQENISAVLDWP